MKCNREGRVKKDSMQQSYRKTLQAQIIKLASEAKEGKFTFQHQEEIFNQQWQIWLTEISQNIQSVTYTSDNIVEVEIYNVLQEQYNAHSHLVTQKVQSFPLHAHGPLCLDIDGYHLDSRRWLSNFTKHAKNVGSKIGVCSLFSSY